MGYWYSKFRDLSIPVRRPAQDLGIDAFEEPAVAVLGGAFDPQGAAQGYRRVPYAVQAEGIVIADSAAAIGSAFYDWRGMFGSRGTLYRTRDGMTADGEWVMARLVKVEARRELDDALMLPLGLTFEVADPIWHGASKSPAYPVKATVQEYACNNAGNARVEDAVLTLVTVADVTALNVTAPEVSWSWSGGTVPSGGTLIIDCGSRSVMNNGTAAYAQFSLGTAHASEGWLPLPPGTTTVSVTASGGGTASVLTIAFTDGWY